MRLGRAWSFSEAVDPNPNAALNTRYLASYSKHSRESAVSLMRELHDMVPGDILRRHIQKVGFGRAVGKKGLGDPDAGLALAW